jgi:hypothetical protein
MRNHEAIVNLPGGIAIQMSCLEQAEISRKMPGSSGGTGFLRDNSSEKAASIAKGPARCAGNTL